MRAEERRVWEDTRWSPAVLLEKVHLVLCLMLTNHVVTQRGNHAALPSPECEISNGRNVQYCQLFSHPLFSRFYRVSDRGLIPAHIDQARQVDQTWFPCMENEGGAYLAITFMKKSDSVCSALCIDSSKNNLLSYTPRYRSGRS